MSVSTPPPLPVSRLGHRLSAEPVITQLMRQALQTPGLLSLAAGFTDNAVLPVEMVEAAVARLRADSPSREFLQYGSTHGRPGLRAATAAWLATYAGEEALALDPSQVLIGNGSQQSLYMSAQLFCDPGDIVLVEPPSYFVFLELLKGLGLEARSLPVTSEGRIDLLAFETALQTWQKSGEIRRVKMLYFMGTYGNPSSRCWPEEDKVGLAEVLSRREFVLPVIEDMAYRELWFERPWPARSVLSLPEWRNLPALYAGTFTKPFSTGLKVGYVASHCSEWVEKLARIKGHQDFGSTNFNQAIVEEVLRSGDFGRHLERIRPSYRRKMEALDAGLREAGIEELGWHWQKPEGGLLLWAEAPDDWDTSLEGDFYRMCLEEGVYYVPGDLCFGEGKPRNAVRLSFGVLEEAQLHEAARRFGAAARRYASSVRT
jgi:2-aminoadipate transaminase